jgi:small basic protein
MSTTIPPPDSHYISLAQFLAMKELYGTNSENVLAPQYQGQEILVVSELFNVTPFNALVSVPGCAGIRIYYGMDETLKIHAMLVAVDANNQDLLPQGGNAIFAKDSGPPIVEEGQRCPPSC